MGLDGYALRCVIVISVLNVAALVNTQLVIQDIKKVENNIYRMSKRNYEAVTQLKASHAEMITNGHKCL